MNRKIVWSLIISLTIFSGWFAYKYFDTAIPLVNLSITMDKQQAEKEAIKVAQKHGWNLVDYDTAVTFQDDSTLQAFTELEGGGKQAFIDMIKHNYHQPYVWQVRFYKEKEISEYFVYFTPDGYQYGFMQKLPENEAGINISKQQAQSVAEKEAVNWRVELKNYKLLEYEQQVQPGNRVDHAFVYQRHDIALNKGLYRMKIIVSGNKVTGLERYVKIPDEFTRRYVQMYDANKLIATLGQGIQAIFYLFIICLFALFFLHKRRYLLLDKHVKMMSVFASIVFFSALNKFPLIWNNYATNISKFVFLIEYFGSVVMTTLLATLFVGTLCLIVEGLDRYVFGKHIQFFKLWSVDTAASYTILEQTVLGYCFAFIKLGYAVGFSMLASSWGWWFPLSTIVDPNILSTYVPCFSPMVLGTVAGFWEEIGLRALPIAGVLLLTRNSKKQRYWFIAIFIIQALLFGAAHANYPQQPAYYRIVEVFAGSIGFAFLYYFFGFLPGIIAHAVYDVVLFLLPIFTSQLLLQKILGMIGIGIPLWVVLIRRLQKGRFSVVPVSSYNKSWKPQNIVAETKKFVREQGSAIPSYIKNYAYVFGCIGLLLFGFSQEFYFDTPPVVITKQQAEHIAHESIQKRFQDIGSDWKIVVKFLEEVDTVGNKFIYQTYGQKIYKELQNSYVQVPYYSVRYVKFSGSVEQRAEEYGVWIAPTGKVLNTWHKLPEEQPGKDISESQAQAIAYRFIQQTYDISQKEFELVSSESVKHESRRDWEIIVKDTAHYTLDKGQARIMVHIGGDKVVGSMRYVYPPEDWTRQEQDRLTKQMLFKRLCYFIMLFLLLCFAMLALKKIGLQKSHIKLLGLFVASFVVLKLITLGNRWSELLFAMNTSESLVNQLSRLVLSYIVSGIGGGLLLGSMIIFAFMLGKQGIRKDLMGLIPCGMSLGAGVVGAMSFVANFNVQLVPKIPMYHFMNFEIPVLGILTSFFVAEILWTIIFIVALWNIARCYQSEWLQILLFVVGGLSAVGSSLGYVLVWQYFIASILWGVIWYVIYRYVYNYNVELLLISIVFSQILNLIPSAWYHAYPMIWVHASLASIIILLFVIWVSNKLQTTR